MPQQWLVNYPAREAPSQQLPPHPAFSVWKRHIGPVVPAGGDYEYFVEEAFRLHAALESFGTGNCWMHHQWGEHRGYAFNLVTGKKRSADELQAEGALSYGAQPSGHHWALAGEAADDYAPLMSFQRNSGRYVELGGFASGQNDDLNLVFERMYERGIRKALLKRRYRKNPLLEVDLNKWKNLGSVTHAMVDDEAGWTLINDEGRSGVYLVQEFIQMRYEYRSFVINHQPVTGAGCVEEFTPLDNTGESFDDRVREVRSSESAVESNPQVKDILLDFTRRVASEIAEERPEIGGYTLDTALDSEGNPLVIELNGHLNAGFFASQPVRITEALSASAKGTQG